jgi:probable selenium-dependent hydroxylase accessory protein YqeC
MADDPLSLRPSRGRPLFIYPPPPPGAEAGKAHGYSPACIDALAERGLADWILVEADGSRNRPIKAPAAYEPVIPASACAVLGVIGLGCLNKAFTPELVHRMTEFAAVTGLRPGETITPAAAASLVLHPAGLFKNSPALRCLFCNQSDLPGAHEAGEALLQEIHRRAGQAAPHAWIGSVLRDGLLCRSGGRERGPLV